MLSLAPLNRKATAPIASLPNWPGGTRPARHAATPSTNALDPLISVRSRSKKAALGPAEMYCVTAGWTTAGGVPSEFVMSSLLASSMASLRQCQVVHTPLGDLELADHRLRRRPCGCGRRARVEGGPDLVVADLATRRRTLQHDHVLAARRRVARDGSAASSSVPRHTDS